MFPRGSRWLRSTARYEDTKSKLWALGLAGEAKSSLECFGKGKPPEETSLSCLRMVSSS